MILNYEQISSALTTLKQVKNEQISITNDARNVVVAQLSQAWRSQAQQAYQDAFIATEKRVLNQINILIELFETAAAQSKDGLYQVDVDLSRMNSSVVAGN